MAPCESTAKKVSFEWSHHMISFTDSKVRITLNVSITDSWSEWVKGKSVLLRLRFMNDQTVQLGYNKHLCGTKFYKCSVFF